MPEIPSNVVSPPASESKAYRMHDSVARLLQAKRVILGAKTHGEQEQALNRWEDHPPTLLRTGWFN